MSRRFTAWEVYALILFFLLCALVGLGLLARTAAYGAEGKKLKIERIKFKDAVEARAFTGATEDNLWLEFLQQLPSWGKVRMTDEETGGVTESSPVIWKHIDALDESVMKPNGRVDKKLFSEKYGITWQKFKEKPENAGVEGE